MVHDEAAIAAVGREGEIHGGDQPIRHEFYVELGFVAARRNVERQNGNEEAGEAEGWKGSHRRSPGGRLELVSRRDLLEANLELNDRPTDRSANVVSLGISSPFAWRIMAAHCIQDFQMPLIA